LRTSTFACGLALALLASSAFAAPPKVDPALHDKALEILKRSIGFRTVMGSDQFVPYAEYLKGELMAGGY
jgi:carboxypeptidase PM20D1